MIDSDLMLPRETVYGSSASLVRSSTMVPSFFALWADKTGDKRAALLASRAREYWQDAANRSTGLVPDRAFADGTLAVDADEFTSNSYGYLLALAVDSIWAENTPWHAEEADLLLAFFREPLASKTFATLYSTSGVPGSNVGDSLSLKAAVAASAVAASVPYREEFVQAVWDATLSTGTSRKFGNLIYLKSALILGGRFRVY